MTLHIMLVLSLATWRLSNLLVKERGPFACFEWIRARFDLRVDAETKLIYLKDGSRNEIGMMLLCPLCTSLWVAGAITLFYLLLPTITYWTCMWLAASAVSCVISQSWDW